MPDFVQQIIWSDVKFEFRMISALIWYTYCWYEAKNDKIMIFTYPSLYVVYFVNVINDVIGFDDVINANNVNNVDTFNNDANANNNNHYYFNW